MLTAAALLAVASRIDPYRAGLSLTYALDLTKFLKFGTRIASKLETDFNSVERVAQYLEVRLPVPMLNHRATKAFRGRRHVHMGDPSLQCAAYLVGKLFACLVFTMVLTCRDSCLLCP